MRRADPKRRAGSAVVQPDQPRVLSILPRHAHTLAGFRDRMIMLVEVDVERAVDEGGLAARELDPRRFPRTCWGWLAG